MKRGNLQTEKRGIRRHTFIRKTIVSRIVITIPHHSSHPSVDRLNAWVECISGSLHAALKIMGWQAFTDLISNANIPDRYVYLIEEVTSKVNDPPD